jgi:hypothetical protein
MNVSPHSRSAITAELIGRGWPPTAITRFFVRYDRRYHDRLTKSDRAIFERAFRHRTKQALNAGVEALPLRPQKSCCWW